MLETAPQSNLGSTSAELSAFLSRILLRCLDIRAVWSVGHDVVARIARHHGHDLLVFADGPTLQTLRRSEILHRADMQVLVVFDGEHFESAWGRDRRCGSLARWAWRPAAHDVAYYDHSTWAELEGAARTVVRVRKKAFLIWSSQ